MSFVLREIVPNDIEEMAALMSLALKKDDMWSNVKGTASDEGERRFIVDWIGPRTRLKDNYEGWKIVETATGKIAAWAMLANLNADNRPALDSKPPQPPEGWNLAAAKVFEERLLSGSRKYGYDPEIHCHRAMTMVHPEFQRRGFGKWISQRCNDSADRAGQVTWCRARPDMTRLLLTMGYELLDMVEIDFRQYGGNASTQTFCLRRAPRPFSVAVETVRT